MSAKVSRLTLQASAAKTASNNGQAVSVDSSYDSALVFLNVTAASGTTPTLDVKLQTSDDGGTTWYDLPNGSFTQKTNIGSQVLAFTSVGDTIRVASTVGGTSPSFTYAVKAVLK